MNYETLVLIIISEIKIVEKWKDNHQIVHFIKQISVRLSSFSRDPTFVSRLEDESRHFDGFTNRLIDFLTDDRWSGFFRSSAGLRAGLHKDKLSDE